MPKLVEQRLGRLLNAGQGSMLGGGKTGLEKESLRVSPDGRIALTPHPAVLGSALTNPHVTTDYSEALLELITPAFNDPRETLPFLHDVHRFVYDNLGEDYLWATSMPCVIEGETSIPIAQYGSSNIGKMKTVYRVGLGHRYGKTMQVISGVHFNYSIPETFWPVFQDLEKDDREPQDFISESYMGMVRNIQRYGWLVPYLLGASPAVCKSFMGGQPTDMQEFDPSSYYEPYATTLRMGDIGYTNTRADAVGVKACYDTLDDYICCLSEAIATPHPEFEKIGIKVDGEYRQLNTNILQIENEYYNSVRPKQISQRYEKPTIALKRRGIQYVELRTPDVNAFEPLGIAENQMRFLEAFMVFCLLADSPPIHKEEYAAIDQNQRLVSRQGREPGLKLHTAMNGKSERSLQHWAGEICEAMTGVCEQLDRGASDAPYIEALNTQRAAVDDPDRTPSARMLAEMRSNKEAFYHFARRKSLEHRDYFQNIEVDNPRAELLKDVAAQSLKEQAEIEASDAGKSFDEFLDAYFKELL